MELKTLVNVGINVDDVWMNNTRSVIKIGPFRFMNKTADTNYIQSSISEPTRTICNNFCELVTAIDFQSDIRKAFTNCEDAPIIRLENITGNIAVMNVYYGWEILEFFAKNYDMELISAESLIQACGVYNSSHIEDSNHVYERLSKEFDTNHGKGIKKPLSKNVFIVMNILLERSVYKQPNGNFYLGLFDLFLKFEKTYKTDWFNHLIDNLMWAKMDRDMNTMKRIARLALDSLHSSSHYNYILEETKTCKKKINPSYIQKYYTDVLHREKNFQNGRSCVRKRKREDVVEQVIVEEVAEKILPEVWPNVIETKSEIPVQSKSLYNVLFDSINNGTLSMENVPNTVKMIRIECDEYSDSDLLDALLKHIEYNTK